MAASSGAEASGAAGPVSFGFSRKAERRRVLAAGPCAEPGGDAGPDTDFLTAVEDRELLSARPAPPPPKELVIPLLPSHRWRNPEPPRHAPSAPGHAPSAPGHAPSGDEAPAAGHALSTSDHAPSATDHAPSPSPAPDPVAVETQAVRELLEVFFLPPPPQVEGLDPETARAVVRLALGGQVVTVSQHSLRPGTPPGTGPPKGKEPRRPEDEEGREAGAPPQKGDSKRCSPPIPGLQEAMLETVIPRGDADRVMVVLGEHAGKVGQILERDPSRSRALVQLQREAGSRVLALDYDAICHFLGGHEDD
nr:G-patch domain and KOW motifs-containing protein [Anser cygnoides]